MFKRTATALAVASCFASGVVQANPTNPVVVSGTAVMQQSGNLLSITNSPNAIINWGSFSIGANEITRFIQQSQASAVLNRVVGQDPSAILGALQSNGRVFLINPNGIVFGAGSQIDVAGLVASTLSLSDADFLAGRLRFSETLNAGSVVNQGSITTGAGGSVYLVAPDITNSGIITSPKGEVILAAGRSVELVDPGTPNLRVEISAPDTQARNLGQIVAEAGRVGIYAGLINHSGTLQADSAVVGERGQIVLKATQHATLEAGSLTTASGAQGGSITIQSGDTTLVSGTVEARGTQGQGGAVQILGNLVGLTGSASIDASGQTGGGTVLVGGDYQGRNPDIQNAYRTYFGPEASIKADAITSGDGGRVIVWADDATRAYGGISARGGSSSGNGGFVEVSGKNWLDFAAVVDTRAPNGTTGTLMLDPLDVEITAATTSGPGSFDGGDPNVFGSPGLDGSSQITWSTIQSNLAASSVYITTTGDSVSGAADITVSANSPDLNTANTLRFISNQNIIVNGTITNTGSGALELYAGWNGLSTAAPVLSDPGSISINSAIDFAGDVLLRANNGITQSLTAPVTASKLLAQGGIGSVDMQALNMVDTLAGSISVLNTAATSRAFLFNNGKPLAIGSVGGVDGVTVAFTTALGTSYSADIDISTTSGDLNVNQPIVVKSSNIVLCVFGSTCPELGGLTELSAAQDINVNRAIRSSSITLTAGRDINVLDLASFGESINAFGESLGLPSTAGLVLDAAANVKIQNSTVGATTLPGGTSSVTMTAASGTIEISDGSMVSAGHYNATGNGGSASVTLDAANGITVSNSTIQAGGSFVVEGTATVTLDGNGGPVQIIDSAISAYGGFDLNGFPATISITGNGITVSNSTIGATGGSGTDGIGGNATLTLDAGSGALQIQSGSALSATANSASDGGNALIDLAGNTASISDSTLTSMGGGAFSGPSGSGNVTLDANAGITVSNSSISAIGGSGFASGVDGGAASVNLTGGTMVTLTGGSTLISATGGVPGGSGDAQGIAAINISALQGAITNAGGLLKVDSAAAGSTLTLTARDGIGTQSNPIRLDSDSPDLILSNTGSTGDIAISVATGNLQIDDVIDTLNMNPTGVYYAKAESGNITLAGAFAPAGDPLLAGQSVVFSAPAGNVVFDTGGSVTSGALLKVDAVNINQPGGGSITTLLDLTATGSITLQQALGYNLGLLQAGTSITVNSTAGTLNDGNGGSNNILAPTASLTGASGIASVASPLQTQVSNLTVAATGGEMGIFNSGNLALGVSSFDGSNAKIQASGALSLLSPISVAGSLSLLGNGMTIGQGLTTAGNLQLDAGGGNLTISGASVNGANVSLAGGNIDVGGVAVSGLTMVSASNAMTLTTGGSLTVQGGIGTGASASLDSVAGNTTVNVGADVLVRGGSGPGAYGSLIGGPDLFMTVGGAVRMDAGTGAGAYGQIASTSPNSIQILFPNLGAGGYFVNGVEYTVYDALSASGFLAGGVPAILGNNLLITYGLSAPTGLLPPVIETTNTLVDGLLQTSGALVNSVTQDVNGLIAGAGEILTGVEYIGVWGIVDSIRNEFVCR